MGIHPLACVSPSARIGRDVKIGPFCTVEPDVSVGDGCVLQGRVTIKDGTTLGANNHVFEGAVLGGFPQHVNMPEKPGKLRIGSGNTIRENATIHRSLQADGWTVVGDGNLLMVNAHVAHDCLIGNKTIIVNNVMLAGHVQVEDRAYLSGAVGVHQFARIGSLAMVGAHGHISKDVPPYVTVDGLSSLVVGLNSVGLRRAGFRQGDLRQLKAAYRLIYRSGLAWAEMLKRLKTEFPDGPAGRFYEFISRTRRGIVTERRMPPGAIIKFRRDAEEPPADARFKAG